MKASKGREQACEKESSLQMARRKNNAFAMSLGTVEGID